jgi:hypothetical protein
LPCHEIENVIPYEVLLILKCSVGCTWNILIPKIQDWEDSNEVPENNRFWLYFDVKNGMSSEDANSILGSDRIWISARLQAAGITEDNWKHCGYGDKIIALLRSDNSALSQLRKAVRDNKWMSVFSGLFLRMLWFFAASRPINT